jgi:ABC-type transport system involved in cytochrome bd biosynthesis fused ATPase/permease subunit
MGEYQKFHTASEMEVEQRDNGQDETGNSRLDLPAAARSTDSDPGMDTDESIEMKDVASLRYVCNATFPRAGDADKPFNSDDDIVIAIMGVTGSGKSTFISLLAEQSVQVGHSLTSCMVPHKTSTMTGNGSR